MLDPTQKKINKQTKQKRKEGEGLRTYLTSARPYVQTQVS
jgi:hypothetical protein